MNAKLFTETKDGVIVHWELEHEHLMGLQTEVNNLTQWLSANGFTANHGFGNGNTAAKGAGNGSAQADSGAPRCASCGGEMWDNRKNKKNPKAPDFKCKDREGCDDAAWISKSGELRWASSSN